MSNVYEASKPVSEVQPAPPKSGCGCWVWGCLTVVVIGLLGFALAAWLSFRFIGGQIEKYTDETPQELPVVEYGEQELAALETKLEDFKEKIRTDQPVEDLVLTADDINAMIASKEELKGKVFIKIEDGQVKGDISIPLDKLPLGMGKGRYLNASAGFKVAVANGILVVTMEEAEVNGEVVPEEIMKELRRENLVKDVKFEDDTRKALARIESIEVEDGKVVLKVRHDDPATDPATESDTEAAEVTEDDFPETGSEEEPANASDDQNGDAQGSDAQASGSGN